MGRKSKASKKASTRSLRGTSKPEKTHPSPTELQSEETDTEFLFEETESEDEKRPIFLSSREAVREVLDMVGKMPHPGLGSRTIAGILRGETRVNWLSYIARTESWGVFFPNPLPTVENFIKELIRAGYLEGIHFIRLTERGQRVLENQEVPTVRRRLKVVSKRVRPLLWKLLLLRARLANERKAPGLIKDEVLLQLLEKQPTTIEELKQIEGISEFIIQKFGDEIIQIINSFRGAEEGEKEIDG